MTYFDTFFVANLSEGIWVILNERLSKTIRPFAMYPDLVRYRAKDVEMEKESVLIIRGALSQRRNDRIVS